MPDVLPIVPGGHYIAPIQRATTYDTTVAQFENGSQQRWANRGAMDTFVLSLKGISPADRLTMDQFVASKKGSFDQTWTFSFVPTVANLAANYVCCSFEDDKFTWTEPEESQFSGKIRFRQTRVGGAIAPSALTDFPGFGPGGACVTGFPYESTDNYYVSRLDLANGMRSVYYFTGTQGFASRATKSWKLPLTTLSNADLAKLESHFVAACGQLHSFAFTDPYNKKRYTNVHYASDSLSIEHVGYDLNSVTVILEEIYGAGWTV